MTKQRNPAVDALRGLIMIVMALDHVRDFFHADAMKFAPENLERTTAFLFFTRWVTHFCAPVFVFTAGMGACFLLSRGRSRADVADYLWTRGLWLIFLEFTVVRFGMLLAGSQNMVILEVIWALGVSMILLAVLIRVPVKALAMGSVAVIGLHNLLDPIRAGAGGRWWNILHVQGVVPVGPLVVVAAYPLIPWFAVMSAGFCFAHLFALTPERRRKIFARLGLGLAVAFVALRTVNLYGDPSRWNESSAISFFNVTKYPPSLDFLLMTLGPAILLLNALERPPAFLLIYGRVPLFYFVAHLYVIHILAKIAVALQLGNTSLALSLTDSMITPARPAEYGFPLGVVYLVWIGVVASLYPLCRWFDGLKQRRADAWWLSYL